MILIGLILLVLALVVPALHVLFWIGVILLLIGCVLAVAGAGGREIGGRRWWW
ncbi:MAG: hypothetical protein JWO67_2217 [Streptosporangiaceae bacterium]|nr:hypothetical protein [Streptosporangiaceae bacterium]